MSEVRNHLGIGSETRIVATLTKLGPQRGNEYLLKAAAEVLKTLHGVLFLLIYKPTYFHRLPNRKYVPVSSAESEIQVAALGNLVRELEIEENVRLIESPHNVDEIVAACDLIVAPFLSERFSSVSLLEAMAMGRPVVATDIGEQREIIQNGRNGYLVPPGDVKELTDRIVDVLSRPGELRRLSGGAREAARRYSVDAYVSRLEALYTELATNGAGSRVPMGRIVG
jgi:glycosyltransferase involved in cell wall biosynthesis